VPRGEAFLGQTTTFKTVKTVSEPLIPVKTPFVTSFTDPVRFRHFTGSLMPELLNRSGPTRKPAGESRRMPGRAMDRHLAIGGATTGLAPNVAR
jgi:hypothetical protein